MSWEIKGCLIKLKEDCSYESQFFHPYNYLKKKTLNPEELILKVSSRDWINSEESCMRKDDQDSLGGTRDMYQTNITT